MGVFVSIRGWLECDSKQLAAIQEIIASQDDDFYTGGWGFPRRQVNWPCFVFYGGTIRVSGVDWFLDQLRDIAELPASDEDDDRVQGLFLASHEFEGMSEWQIRGGDVVIAPADPRYQYLDA